MVAIFYCNIAFAQFDTIINIPPDPSSDSIAAGTQINVFDGGLLAERFDLFDNNPGGEINFFGGEAGSNLHVNGAMVNLHDGSIGIEMQINSASEVNVSGGRIAFFAEANAGSILNVSGGSIDFGASANSGSTVTVSGGIIGRAFSAQSGSSVTFTGGYVEGAFRAYAGSDVTLMGGVFGEDFFASGALTLHGDGFSVDGVPVPGLTSTGDQVQLSLPLLSEFTGTLADGSPFSFSFFEDDGLYNASIRLVRTALPDLEDLEVHVPAQTVPKGVRSGQTLFIGEGGIVGDDFHAGANGIVFVQGGSIGDNFEAAGARVDITGGEIGDSFGVFAGSVVNIFGGSIGRDFRPLRGSTVNFAGGNAQGVFAPGGSDIFIRGGTMGVNGFWARTDANVLIVGDNFRLNGVELLGLEQIGSIRPIDLPATYVLTGTLSDGTPFAFASKDHDRFEVGTLSLARSETPPIETTIINVPDSPAPHGIRAGQTLVVHQGGDVADNFNAGSGSTIEIGGGAVGDNFEAVGAMVHLADGKIGNWFDAFAGTTVVIEGGSVGQHFHAGPGSVVSILDGHLGSGFSAFDGSTIEINGGEIDGLGAFGGAQVTISGGVFNAFSASPGATVELIGTQFLLDGESIPALENPGDSILLPNRNGEVLHVRLRDGSTNDFILRTPSRAVAGSFSTGSVLRLTFAVPEPNTSLIALTSVLFLFRRNRAI